LSGLSGRLPPFLTISHDTGQLTSVAPVVSERTSVSAKEIPLRGMDDKVSRSLFEFQSRKPEIKNGKKKKGYLASAGDGALG